VTFTDVFVKRPVLAVVISLLIVLLGVLGFVKLPVRETPQVDNPIVTVTTVWPSADPAIVESDVTEQLERQLNGIEGVRTITSTSQDGRSRSRSSSISGGTSRPPRTTCGAWCRARGRRCPTRSTSRSSRRRTRSARRSCSCGSRARGRICSSSPRSPITLVRERIENVPGVAAVQLLGAAHLRDAHRARFGAHGVAPGHRRRRRERACAAGNVDVPAGKVEGASTQLTLHLEGGPRDPEEFGSLVVKTDGSTKVLLREVADVRLGAENERAAARGRRPDDRPLGRPAGEREHRRRLGRGPAPASPRSEEPPRGHVRSSVVLRPRAVGRKSIHDVELTLFVAFALVVLVIFLFLRDVRSTLVPAVAIPVSIVGTFLVLGMGFTINVFTLFGLVLAIGLVVDDAIVVLENIVRRIEEGRAPSMRRFPARARSRRRSSSRRSRSSRCSCPSSSRAARRGGSSSSSGSRSR
jgi:multidrug efflux pump